MSNSDSTRNSPKPRLNERIEGQQRPEQNNRLDNAPDVSAAREATADAINDARSLNRNRPTGSMGGKGTLEVVTHEGGKEKVLVSREIGTAKDFSKYAARAQHITESELQVKADSGDMFARDFLNQLRIAENSQIRAEVQRSADRMFGRGEFAIAQHENNTQLRRADTRILKLIESDEKIPEDKRHLAGQIQQMRAESKARGVPTDPIDEFASVQFAKEIESKTYAPTNELFKPQTFEQLLDGLVTLGPEKLFDSEYKSFYKGLEKLITTPNNDTYKAGDVLQGFVRKFAADRVNELGGVTLGHLRFTYHTVEGLVASARMGRSIEQHMTPMGWIIDDDPEATQMLAKTIEGEGQLMRLLFHLGAMDKKSNVSSEIDPQGAMMAREFLAKLPGEVDKMITDYENADGLEKTARGTELGLNIISLFIGGGEAGAANAANKARVLTELGTIGKGSGELSEGVNILRSVTLGEKFSAAETLSQALLASAERMAQTIGALAKRDPRFQSIADALAAHADEFWKPFDDGIELMDKVRENLPPSVADWLKLPKSPMQPAFATSHDGPNPASVLSKPGSSEQAGFGKTVEEIINRMVGKGSAEPPIRLGKEEPLRPPELDGIKNAWKEPFTPSGSFESLYVTGDQELKSAQNVAALIEKTPEELGRMGARELKEHGLLRLNPAETDLVLQRRMQSVFEKAFAASTETLDAAKYRDACIEVRMILKEFYPEIEERNLAICEATINGNKEFLIATSCTDMIPGTVVPPIGPRIFNTLDVRVKWADSEFKIMEYLIRKYGPTNLKGEIKIFTEQKPCRECKDVIFNQAEVVFGEDVIIHKPVSIYPRRKDRIIFTKQKMEETAKRMMNEKPE